MNSDIKGSQCYNINVDIERFHKDSIKNKKLMKILSRKYKSFFHINNGYDTNIINNEDYPDNIIKLDVISFLNKRSLNHNYNDDNFSKANGEASNKNEMKQSTVFKQTIFIDKGLQTFKPKKHYHSYISNNDVLSEIKTRKLYLGDGVKESTQFNNTTKIKLPHCKTTLSKSEMKFIFKCSCPKYNYFQSQSAKHKNRYKKIYSSRTMSNIFYLQQQGIDTLTYLRNQNPFNKRYYSKSMDNNKNTNNSPSVSLCRKNNSKRSYLNHLISSKENGIDPIQLMSTHKNKTSRNNKKRIGIHNTLNINNQQTGKDDYFTIDLGSNLLKTKQSNNSLYNKSLNVQSRLLLGTLSKNKCHDEVQFIHKKHSNNLHILK